LSRRCHCGGVNVVNLVKNVNDMIIAPFIYGRLLSAPPQPSPPPSPAAVIVAIIIAVVVVLAAVAIAIAVTTAIVTPTATTALLSPLPLLIDCWLYPLLLLLPLPP
jgi:hypothetical protein